MTTPITTASVDHQAREAIRVLAGYVLPDRVAAEALCNMLASSSPSQQVEQQPEAEDWRKMCQWVIRADGDGDWISPCGRLRLGNDKRWGVKPEKAMRVGCFSPLMKDSVLASAPPPPDSAPVAGKSEPVEAKPDAARAGERDIRRYMMNVGHPFNSDAHCVSWSPHEYGDWVKYTDHYALIDSLRKERDEAAERAGRGWKETNESFRNQLSKAQEELRALRERAERAEQNAKALGMIAALPIEPKH